MSLRRITIAGLIGLCSIGAALACGPFFPWQLLDDRRATVTGSLDLGFAPEIKRLMPRLTGTLPVVERAGELASSSESEVEIAEREEAQSGAWQHLASLPADEAVAKLQAARAAPDDKAALAAATGLPAAVAEYLAGAREFRLERFDTALTHFEAIDRLPPEQRRIRAVAAAYMQGRVHQRTGAFEAARTAFQATRARALAGAPDPMGLAVASLGEEARVDLIEAGLARTEWPFDPSKVDDAKADSLIAEAIELYAEQAVRGSRIGLLSLRLTLFRLCANADVLRRVVAIPRVRSFLVAYMVSRDGEWTPEDPLPENTMAGIIDAIFVQPVVATGDDLDRLAALAYAHGRYSAAERFVASSHGIVGLWVRAKLAIRRDDRAAAVRDWTAALTAADAANALDEAARARLRGETAIGQLSQGAYKDSLRLLFPVAQTFWGDLIYVAERVLTVDELKAFVDGLPPAPAPKPVSPDGDDAFPASPTASLRALLARRLVRVRRVAEALPYFPSEPPRNADRAEDDRPVADDAREYLAALETARTAARWRRVTRAEALFTAAMLARQRGMEMMGTEGPPDLFAVGGSFDFGYGQKEVGEYSPLVGPGEARRFAESAPRPNQRFHYRVVAMHHALAAADLLPQRSQAYAATLCWAARFAIDSGDQNHADAIYLRYLRTGAYQAWANRFGRVCPQPNFEAARDYWLRWIALSVRQHKVIAAGIALALVLLIAGSIVAIRRRRTA